MGMDSRCVTPANLSNFWQFTVTTHTSSEKSSIEEVRYGTAAKDKTKIHHFVMQCAFVLATTLTVMFNTITVLQEDEGAPPSKCWSISASMPAQLPLVPDWWDKILTESIFTFLIPVPHLLLPMVLILWDKVLTDSAFTSSIPVWRPLPLLVLVSLDRTLMDLCSFSPHNLGLGGSFFCCFWFWFHGTEFNGVHFDLQLHVNSSHFSPDS